MSTWFKATLAIALAAGISGAQTDNRKLVGLWQTYRQMDRAKIVSCFYSIEFKPDGNVIQKYLSDTGMELHCRYFVKGRQIRIVCPEVSDSWRYDFKFLKNGDLYLHKDPWNWRGWLTRNASRVPKDHGCSWLNRTPVPTKGK